MKTRSSKLSKATRKQLAAVRARRETVQIWNLLFALLAVLLILASLAMLLDWVIASRGSLLRVATSLSVCGGFFIFARWVWRQLPIDGGVRGTAKWLDAINPALQERLLTVVELSGKDSHSPALLDAVGKQVDLIGVRDHRHRVILTKPFLGALAALGCGLMMVVLVKSISGSSFGGLLARLIHPWSERTLTNLTQTVTERYHVKGRPFEISLAVSGKIPLRAELEYRLGDGSVEQREVVIEQGTRTLKATIPPAEKDFSYRVIAGDGETPWHQVKVIDRPQLKDAKLVITPPSYTKAEEQRWTTLPRRVEVPEGSQVSLSFTADQDLPGAKFIQRGGQKELTSNLLPDTQGRFQFQSQLTTSIEAEIELTSVIGELQSRFAITLATKPDSKPRVQLLESTETFAMTAAETLDVAFQASDDYGIKSAELVAELTKADGTKEEFRFPLDLQDKAGAKDIQINASLDLKQIPIAKGDELQFAVEVRDEKGLQAKNPTSTLKSQQLSAQEIARLQENFAKAQKHAESLQATQAGDSPTPTPPQAETARALAAADKAAQQAKQALKNAQEKAKAQQDLEKRRLDVAADAPPASKSASAKVTVDEFAEYRLAGDGRKKQQIAIQEVLDLILKSALAGRSGIAQAGTPPGPEEDADRTEDYSAFIAIHAVKIQEVLKVGANAAEELRKRSEGTPYSFFGLQAKAMVENGFAPAQAAITTAVAATTSPTKATHWSLADERLRWVINLLEKNKQQLEQMIAYQEVLELTHQFKKMHEITLEDMPPSSKCCRAGPYAKLKNELSDAQVQQQIANLKLKREVLKRLSELLQKNPELRARHLAQNSESSKIYREELSRLRNRQKDLTDATFTLTSLPVGPLPPAFSSIMQQRLRHFSDRTTEAMGLARIWIPTDTPLASRKELENSLSQLSQQVEQLATANPLADNEFKSAVDAVRKTKLAADKLLAQPPWENKYSDYSSFRIEDLAGMATELDACVALAKSLLDQTGHLFLSQLQKELNAETRTITLGMMDQLASISGVSPIADKKIEEIAQLLSKQLYPAQQLACNSLLAKDLAIALNATCTASGNLEQITSLLDSAITEFIRAKSAQDALSQQAKMPLGAAESLPDPTKAEIDEMLAKLLNAMEQESRKSNDFKLGISYESNLKIKDDWEKQSKNPAQEKSEKEALDQQMKEQQQAAQQAAAAAGKAQQLANFKAQEIARQLGQNPAVTWREKSVVQFEGRNDWNAIQSQLKESLTQDIDSTVPEGYRTAIEDYFRDISKTQSQ